MITFTTKEAATYTTSLQKQIQVLIAQQNQIKKLKINPKSNKLMTELNNLVKLLMVDIKKDWYDKYLDIYERLFFDQSIQDYTNLIRKDYKSLWLIPSIAEQIEFAEVNNQTYRFPNIGVLSSENFEDGITNAFINATREVVTAFDLIADNGYLYKPEFGIREYRYTVKDKEGEIFEILIYTYQSVIKIQVEPSALSFNFSSVYLKMMLQLICEEQMRAK